MRRVICSLALLGLAQQALAADYGEPYLRGSNPYEPGTPTYARWAGFYGGGQAGTAFASFDFSDSTGALVGYILRNTVLEAEAHPSQWSTLGKGSGHGSSYGGFVGYNSQWEDVILGLELNYNRLKASASSADAISRIVTLSDDFSYTVTVQTSASVDVTDYGTFRGRAGYVMGSFLPYVTLGLAAARANYWKTASVGYPAPTYSLPPPTPPDQPPPTPPAFGPVSRSEGKNGAIVFGYAAGIGMDIALLPNVFVRGEYEFLHLPDIGGISTTINNARLGVGLKF